MSRKVLLSASILSADQSRLADAIAQVKKAGADLIHVDVMDGHFVDNITIGHSVVKSLAEVAEEVGIPLDVHLMIENPIHFLDRFIESKPQFLTIHQEACHHLHMALDKIKKKGIKAGISINPSTPLCLLDDIIPMIDLLLIMSVNPGWGGQKYIELVGRKIIQAREMLDEKNPYCMLEVDGGVNQDNAGFLRETGVDILVAGNAVFKGSGTLEDNIRQIKGL